MGSLSSVTEDDPRKLYVPEDTQAAQDQDKIYNNFGIPNSVTQVYGVAVPEGDNMLTTSSMLEVYDAWEEIANVSTSYNNKEVNYTRCALLMPLSSHLVSAL